MTDKMQQQNGTTANSSSVQVFNRDYVRTLPGILRIAEGSFALAALISSVEGFCVDVRGQYAFSLFVIIVSMLNAIFIFVSFLLNLQHKIKFIDITFALLINDFVILVLYFVTTTLSMLTIGRCSYGIVARTIAAMFTIILFLILIGLSYLNYLRFQERTGEKEFEKNSGTTVTQASPTVLT